MLVAACPGGSRRAHSWADAQLRGVMESQEWPQQPEHNPKQTRKSNLGSGKNQQRSQDTAQTQTLKGRPAVREQGMCHRASSDSHRLDSPAAPALLPTGTLTTSLFPGLWYEEGNERAWFCFMVPMISRVNCNQHIPSPSASKGRSQGGECARLAWLHVPNVPLKLLVFQNFCAQAVC